MCGATNNRSDKQITILNSGLLTRLLVLFHPTRHGSVQKRTVTCYLQVEHLHRIGPKNSQTECSAILVAYSLKSILSPNVNVYYAISVVTVHRAAISELQVKSYCICAQDIARVARYVFSFLDLVFSFEPILILKLELQLNLLSKKFGNHSNKVWKTVCQCPAMSTQNTARFPFSRVIAVIR